MIRKLATNKIEVQYFFGVMGFWRMHVPGYSLIYTGYSLTLYFLRRKILKGLLSSSKHLNELNG